MLRKDPFITGQYYHIYNRGVDKKVIFNLFADYERFMMLLYISNSSQSFRLGDFLNRENKKYDEILMINRGAIIVSIGAWCLMPNHFHILIKQEVEGGITKFMRKLSTGYSMCFNKKNDRQGALFSGRFKSKLVNEDNYMRQLLSYIHLNPLKIAFPDWERDKGIFNSEEMKSFLESYRFSSYNDYLNNERLEGFILNRGAFPDYFQELGSFQNFVENYFILEKDN